MVRNCFYFNHSSALLIVSLNTSRDSWMKLSPADGPAVRRACRSRRRRSCDVGEWCQQRCSGLQQPRQLWRTSHAESVWRSHDLFTPTSACSVTFKAPRCHRRRDQQPPVASILRTQTAIQFYWYRWIPFSKLGFSEFVIGSIYVPSLHKTSQCEKFKPRSCYML